MNYRITDNSRVDFTAYAPFHTFGGWVKDGLHGEIAIDFDSREISSLSVSAQTSCFETGELDRNKAMVDFFSLEDYPETSFTMIEVGDFSLIEANTYSVTVTGALHFAGSKRKLPIRCILKREEERLWVDLKFKWSFKAFGFKAPKLLFLTVRDIVDISAVLEFSPNKTE